ncbi:hypothetical protein RF11_12977 [Thelohanellus kitauei]|uniref:Uncharacterized protein n=1 Tax=Thelohanellus kitauei TaxID=669202 RepID=A0A0C2MY02_THEKT|nr:hypothetical protein RF11_12977 [Thelohanellus kitauei]
MDSGDAFVSDGVRIMSATSCDTTARSTLGDQVGKFVTRMDAKIPSVIDPSFHQPFKGPYLAITDNHKSESLKTNLLSLRHTPIVFGLQEMTLALNALKIGRDRSLSNLCWHFRAHPEWPSHVLSSCLAFTGLYITRHDKVLQIVARYVREAYHTP